MPQVLLKDYNPSSVDSVESDRDATFHRTISTGSSSTDSSTTVVEDQQPQSPDFEDLNKRFENLLNMAEELQHQGDTNMGRTRPPDIIDGIPRHHHDQDLELEEVNITASGIEIVPNPGTVNYPRRRQHSSQDINTSGQGENCGDEEEHWECDSVALPPHLQEIVSKVLQEMQ